ncbi:MAG: hypothetical protein AAGB22_00905, partial [Bacteroidota bacterium]
NQAMDFSALRLTGTAQKVASVRQHQLDAADLHSSFGITGFSKTAGTTAIAKTEANVDAADGLSVPALSFNYWEIQLQ